MLERQELTRVGARLAEERQLPFRAVQEGERVRSLQRDCATGIRQYALVQSAREFVPVPWPDKWQVIGVPHLPIVSDDVWDSA
jgi:Protein of unknown function (DUF3363)